MKYIEVLGKAIEVGGLPICLSSKTIKWWEIFPYCAEDDISTDEVKRIKVKLVKAVVA